MRVLFKKSVAGSSKENEDNYYIGENYCILLDGETALDGTSDVRKYTEKLIRRINTNYSNSLSLKDILRKSIEDIYLIYPNGSPSACIVMMRENKDTIDFLNLGNSTILYSDTHGDVFSLDDVPSLINLDKQVYKRIKEISLEKEITPKEALETEEIQNMLLNNRNLKNTKNGYYILENNSKVINNVSTWTLDKKDIDTILLASDGLTEYYNEMELTDMESFFYLVKLDGEYVFKNLKKEQLNDKELNSVRFKVSDDTTGIMIKVN